MDFFGRFFVSLLTGGSLSFESFLLYAIRSWVNGASALLGG